MAHDKIYKAAVGLSFYPLSSILDLPFNMEATTFGPGGIDWDGKNGVSGDSNAGPSALRDPKADIIPLDYKPVPEYGNFWLHYKLGYMLRIDCLNIA